MRSDLLKNKMDKTTFHNKAQDRIEDRKSHEKQGRAVKKKKTRLNKKQGGVTRAGQGGRETETVFHLCCSLSICSPPVAVRVAQWPGAVVPASLGVGSVKSCAPCSQPWVGSQQVPLGLSNWLGRGPVPWPGHPVRLHSGSEKATFIYYVFVGGWFAVGGLGGLISGGRKQGKTGGISTDAFWRDSKIAGQIKFKNGHTKKSRTMER